MKRTYVGELEWVVGQINMAQGDSNPNRAAQLRKLCDYGSAVGIARRGKEPLPPRPDPNKMV